MNDTMKETVLEAAEYTYTNMEKDNRRVRICNAIACFLILIYHLLKDTDIFLSSALVNGIASCLEGVGIGMLIVGMIMSTHYGIKFKNFKKRIISSK